MGRRSRKQCHIRIASYCVYSHSVFHFEGLGIIVIRMMRPGICGMLIISLAGQVVWLKDQCLRLEKSEVLSLATFFLIGV